MNKQQFNYIENFYNNKYENYKHPSPSNLFEKMYTIFKKYELHRIDCAVNLLESGKRILDVGVGFGDLLIKVRKQYKNLLGIDVSEEVVNKCKVKLKNLNVEAEISKMSIDVKTTFNNNYFDAVTIIAVLEHLFDPVFVLSEIHRILRKNGILIIEVPNAVFLLRRISFLFGKLPKTSDESLYHDGHLQYFTHDSLIHLLKNAGFVVEYSSCSGIGWKIRSILPTLLGSNIVIKARKL